MKFILIILVLGILAAGYVYYLKSLDGRWEEKTISIDGHKLLVKIADTKEKREQGLQEVEKLGENEGMLFVFTEAQPVTMWNKNLRLDLDILWVKNFTVVGVDLLPKIEGSRPANLDSPAGGADMVIEAPAGWVVQNGIRPGALVLDI
ncbi:MAG: DUF192 domain-containing protein [bacterium]|nr:DUF192 domain-containing protein [bacterium]